MVPPINYLGITMSIPDKFKKMLDEFPFLSLVSYGGEEYIGIIQNQDGGFTSVYVFDLIKSQESKIEFLNLGDEWWWGTNRQIPINIIMGSKFSMFSDVLVTFSGKDFEVIHGPCVCLRNMMKKRVKRKNVKLVKKTN